MRLLVATLLSCAFISCAQVPKEAVELSTTVGRDLAVVHKAHRETALILFGRIKSDINRFVDNVYLPYQIDKLLQGEQNDFLAGKKDNIFGALDEAIKNPGTRKKQKEALQFLDIFVQLVQADVEDFRALKLSPILAQEKDLLSRIDRSYQQMHHANSIVTGHLASIRKVHDAQEELLNKIGIEGLREEVGTKLAKVSNRVGAFVNKAKEVDGTLDEMTKKIEKMKKGLDKAIAGEDESGKDK